MNRRTSVFMKCVLRDASRPARSCANEKDCSSLYAVLTGHQRFIEPNSRALGLQFHRVNSGLTTISTLCSWSFLQPHSTGGKGHDSSFSAVFSSTEQMLCENAMKNGSFGLHQQKTVDLLIWTYVRGRSGGYGTVFLCPPHLTSQNNTK